MNGANDFGGQMGFGSVEPEAETIRFHEEWEKRVLALTVAAGGLGLWNIDASRYSKEIMAPLEYLQSSYYERWLVSLENLLVEHDMLTRQELSEGRSLNPPNPKGNRLHAAELLRRHAAGTNFIRPRQSDPRFGVGAFVVTKNNHPQTHTRLPRYARGRKGTIVSVHDTYVYPDTHAHGNGENPCWLYTVSFDAKELWADTADGASEVCIDLWENYLEPA